MSMVKVVAAPELPLGASALGAVSTSSLQRGTVVLAPGNASALTSFLNAVSDKSSPLFHHYLAPGAFAQRFGPSQATLSAVKAQLTSEGLNVSGVSRDDLLVSFSGSAAAVESAFRTRLERYRLADGAIGQATTTALSVPSSIAGSVTAVIGLNDLVKSQPTYTRPGPASVQATFPKALAPTFSHPADSPDACGTAQVDAENSGGLTDDAIANSYGAFGLYELGDFGSGQHIAIYELQPFLASDIETFDTCYFGAAQAASMAGENGKLSGSRLSVIPVDGGEPQPGVGSENDEATLDIEDVSAIAPQAKIDVYEAPNTNVGGLDEYARIVDDDTDQIVSSSWAVCEQLAQYGNPGVQQAENLLFEQAAAQGQTVLSAAGDTGDDECNSSRPLVPLLGQNLLSLLDPGSQPYVLSVGGTTIDDATQPASEHVWNDGAQWGAGGGGISQTWAMPSWQQPLANTAANAKDVANAEAYERASAKESVPFTTPTFCDATLHLVAGALCRETPDVTAQADEFTGSVTIFGQSLGYGPKNGWATIGGTSSATPIWAALLALVNASPQCSADKINGVQDVGFASPILYGIADNPTAYARSFNDIVSGNNDEYGLDNGLIFPAHPGYDMASGLGSPQLTTPSGGNALAFYMCQYSGPTAQTTVSGLSPSTGPTTGGYTVTVSGSGFGTASDPRVASVQVGTTRAKSFAVTSGSKLNVVFPPAAATLPPGSPRPDDGAGPAVVTVRLKSGVSSHENAASVFEYVDETPAVLRVPSITSLTPSGGLESSSTPVTIFGSGFTRGTRVSFGGVPGKDVKVRSRYAMSVMAPAYSRQSCAPLPKKGVYKHENARNDICQVEVVATNANGSSATSKILFPFEGGVAVDSLGVQKVPTGYEFAPQPTEFDYAPAPRITSVSTGTVAQLKHCVAPATTACNAALLAAEGGGMPSNLVTLKGIGMNELTFDYLLLGSPADENAVALPVAATGTTMELIAPQLPKTDKLPTTEPFPFAVRFASLAGRSNKSNIVYAGVPVLSSVVDTATGGNGVPDTTACASPAPKSGCGTSIRIEGEGLLQTVSPVVFVDGYTGFSLGTQYNFAVKDNKTIATESVAQNPGVVDVEVCSVTGCSYDPNGDQLFVYPPGNPKIDSITPATGAAHGGNVIVLHGSNLGCIVAVAFGKVVTLTTTNTKALLTCGSTDQVEVVAPPGVAGTTVGVRVATVESFFSEKGNASNSLAYSYTPSAPSQPVDVIATAAPGRATVKWRPPTSDGGSPVTGYAVTASSPGMVSVRELGGATTRKMTFTDLQAGASWTFSVRAVSNKGAGLRALSSPVAPALGNDGYLVETGSGGVLGFGDVTAHGGIEGGGRRRPGWRRRRTPSATGS